MYFIFLPTVLFRVYLISFSLQSTLSFYILIESTYLRPQFVLFIGPIENDYVSKESWHKEPWTENRPKRFVTLQVGPTPNIWGDEMITVILPIGRLFYVWACQRVSTLPGFTYVCRRDLLGISGNTLEERVTISHFL